MTDHTNTLAIVTLLAVALAVAAHVQVYRKPLPLRGLPMRTELVLLALRMLAVGGCFGTSAYAFIKAYTGAC